ncbi:MAG: hypothetical protein KDC99_18545 [Cyclobacteriaceae bacterium]|nr:hypothetical protein [Cyclobacteriaceae bacterium]
MSKILNVAVENLLLSLENPRYPNKVGERQAAKGIVEEQREKLLNLADDIVEKGLNPSELVIVASMDEGETYTVLEGNRRVAALKLIHLPSFLKSLDIPQKYIDHFLDLNQRSDSLAPRDVPCVVLPPEDAKYWIKLKHTGENEGKGVVPWNGMATQRFKGASPSLQAIEQVEQSDLIDDETRKNLSSISITNVERILNTPEARELLGVDVQKGHLTLKNPENEALGRLAIIISDVANKNIKVTHLDTRTQRIDYAREVLSRELPKPMSKSVSSSSSSSKVSPSKRRVSHERRTLIPKTFKVSINQPRINRIYQELQSLNLKEFINASAVMLRVFVEMSVEEYAKRNKISLKKIEKGKQPRDLTLRDKIKAAIDHMAKQGISKSELQGIRTLHGNRNHVLSVDSLHGYVHNKNYSPTAGDLKTNWDNIEAFMQHLWA